jgi:hypothetical protein
LAIKDKAERSLTTILIWNSKIHSKRRRKIKENPGKIDHHFMGAIL